MSILMSDKPQIEICEQPKTGELRFRYPTEGDKAGSILGIRSTSQRVTYPSFRLLNCAGKHVLVIASCVTASEPYFPHPHRLVGQGCQLGALRLTIDCASNDHVIQLTKIGIQCCKQKDGETSLRERDNLANCHQYIRGHTGSMPISFDLSTVRLCFQMFVCHENNQLEYCDMKVSDPIVDKKAVQDLVIWRSSRISGSVRGGDEVFILCSGIKKDDIEVLFASPDGTWKAKADFFPTDVHRQAAIVFKTPPYHCQTIDSCVDVNYYLRCPSKNTTSKCMTFRYFAEDIDPYQIEKKRKLNPQPLSAFVSAFKIPSSLNSSTVLRSSHVGTLPHRPTHQAAQGADLLKFDNASLNMHGVTPLSSGFLPANWDVLAPLDVEKTSQIREFPPPLLSLASFQFSQAAAALNEGIKAPTASVMQDDTTSLNCFSTRQDDTAFLTENSNNIAEVGLCLSLPDDLLSVEATDLVHFTENVSVPISQNHCANSNVASSSTSHNDVNTTSVSQLTFDTVFDSISFPIDSPTFYDLIHESENR